MSFEEDKNNVRLRIINRALEEGWTVKKISKDSKTFEFSKTNKGNPIEAKNDLNKIILSHALLLNEIKENRKNKNKKFVSNPL